MKVFFAYAAAGKRDAVGKKKFSFLSDAARSRVARKRAGGGDNFVARIIFRVAVMRHNASDCARRGAAGAGKFFIRCNFAARYFFKEFDCLVHTIFEIAEK